MPDSAHSRLGFSAAGRWLHCPGSVREIARLPPQPSGAAAAQGTREHAGGEWCLRTNLDIQEWDSPDLLLLDRDAMDRVREYVSYVRLMLSLHPGALLLIEDRADCSALHPDLWGTMDALIVLPFVRAIVIDYKGGANRTEASCEQGQGYSLYPWMHFEVPEVTFTIVQPKCGEPRSRTYGMAELTEIRDRFVAGAKATEDPNAPLVPGWWCAKHYCPKAPTCPKLHERAVSVARSDFAQRNIAPPDPTSLAPDQLGLVLDQLEILEGWAKAVRAYALEQAAKGVAIPNRKLVAGRKGPRVWKDPGQAITALQGAGIDPFEEPALVSPPVAERRAGKAQFAALCGDLVRQPDGKPTLAPHSDPRPALAAGAHIDFAEPESE